MHSKVKCRACDKSFIPDTWNQNRQVFCSRPECQRRRRTKTQRKRRERSREEQVLTRRLKPSEAVWLRKKPIIIGLVSVLVGSTDLREIEAFCAAASHRGSQILRGELLDDDGKGLESKEIKRQ